MWAGLRVLYCDVMSCQILGGAHLGYLCSCVTLKLFLYLTCLLSC